MNEEMRVEAMELCVTACEKFSNNNEVRPTENCLDTRGFGVESCTRAEQVGAGLELWTVIQFRCKLDFC